MNNTTEMIKAATLGLAWVVVFGLLTWGGIYVNGFFNAERESQRTRVLHESFAYQRGMQDNLNQLMLEYNRAETNAERIGIFAMVRDQYGIVDTTDYPPHLQQFLRTAGAR